MKKIIVYICNAFSLNMLNGDAILKFKVLSLEEVKNFLIENNEVIEYAVGHLETANLFASLLNRDIPYNRVNVSITDGVQLLIGQYVGPRLEEGATSLPKGASIRWFLVDEYVI
jgi:hypothetical protein